MEFSLLAAALIAFAALYAILWWETGRSDDSGAARALWDTALAAGIAGLVVGRLAAMIQGGSNPLTNPGDVLIVRSGVHPGFAALTALAVASWSSRHRLWPALDALAPAALGGLAAWHGACLVRGACLGTPTGLPWGVAQEGSTVARHPVEIYAALLLLAAAAVLVALRYRSRPPGVITALALIAAGAVRWGTEPLRPGIGTGPELWYALAVAAGVVLAFWALLRSRTSEREALPGSED